MRSIGDIMKDLGFREDGSDETKKAFIQNLIRAAGHQANTNPILAEAKRALERPVEQQLSFQFDASESVRVETRRKSG